MPRFLPRATMLVALYASVALGGPSAEIVVTKPKATSPGTDFSDEELQKSYDEMWLAFQSDIDEATADLEKVLGELREEARTNGRTILTQRWDSIRKDFATKGEVRWDPIKEKKEWRTNYPLTAYPEGYARDLKACRNAYNQAMHDLRVAYEDLASRLTMANEVGNATEILKEAAKILGVHVNGKAQNENGAGKPSDENALLQRLIGTWTHPNKGEQRVFDANGLFQQIVVTSGEAIPPVKVALDKDKVKVALPGGTTVVAWPVGDDLIAFIFTKADGKIVGDGEVWYRKAKHVRLPKGAVEFRNHHYMLIAGKVSWEDAKRTCEGMGGHLVTIGSPEENTFAFQLSQGRPCWIGMYFDGAKANRVWVTGEPVTFQKWRAGQPEGARNLYVGIAWTGTDEWDDFLPRADGHQNFICEWEE